MDENGQQNSEDIFSTLSQTFSSTNNNSGSSVWEILENAVNSIEHSEAGLKTDRDCIRYHSDDLSEYMAREPRLSSVPTTGLVSDSPIYQPFMVSSNPTDFRPQDQVVISSANDPSVATFENDHNRSQEFSNFGENQISSIPNTSTGKFSEVINATLPSNLLVHQHRSEKTIGGSQVDDHYLIEQPNDVMGAELPEEELLLLLNEATSSSSTINNSGLSTNYQITAEGQLEDLGKNVSFSHHGDQDVGAIPGYEEVFGSSEDIENHQSPCESSSSSSTTENALSLATLESCITSPVTSAYSDFALDDAVIESEMEANRESFQLVAEEVVHEEVQETQASSGAPTYLCPVCGNQNGRHAHYGGYSCPSCRAFFRRSVQSKAYKTFSCNSGKCKINSKSWRSCKWCRYQKCLKSGMKPEWVLDKNERNSKAEKRSISEVAQEALVDQGPTALAVRSSNFTNDELLQILSYVDCRKMNMSHSLLHFYASNPYLFRDLACAIYSKNIIPFSTYKHLENKWPCTMEDFVIKDSELGVLSNLDSLRLLQANFPLLQIFIQSVIMINNQHFKATPLANILKRSLNITPVEDERHNVGVLSDVLKDLKIDSKKSQTTTGLTYSQVFSSPWAESKELEERHAQLTKEISSWPVNPKDPAKHVDKVQLFLLANIIMLSTDNVTVQDYAKVTEVQGKYMIMLHRYLKYKYKDKYNTHFAKGLMIASLAREAKEIRRHRLPV